MRHLFILLLIMKKIYIIVPKTAILASIVDPQYMFNAVNNFFAESGHQPFFQVELVGFSSEIKLLNGNVSIHPTLLIKECRQADLVIIPAISGNMIEAIELNKEYIKFIQNQYQGGAEIASLCVGAFLLAATGLLAGKKCSTHWLFANEFKEMFPDVQLTYDKIITDQSGLYTSGGATSYWNLLLYLVEKFTNRNMAIMASKFFLLDIDKESQLPFGMFKGQKLHDDPLILSAQNFIEENYKNKITVDKLANRFNLGRRTLERRFKKQTTNTIVEYIQKVKIEAAKKELEKGIKTVNEIMYDVGYTDNKSFRMIFKKYAGLSPLNYRKRYS